MLQPEDSGDRVVPRPVLERDWIGNGTRLIRVARQSIVRTNLSDVHCAFIQFSDPVNLTDTSEKKIRKGVSVRRTVVVRRDKERACFLVAFPCCVEDARLLGPPTVVDELL